MPKNWRLVIEDAKKFKKEFGDKNGKIDFWISATRTNKSASTLYELLSYCRELEKLYKEKEVLDEALIDMPKRLKVVKYKIELLEDKINE
jgi:lipid II:glycine glycyltransferase (peptidoglycan interpeptide bridge formation enzyme)